MNLLEDIKQILRDDEAHNLKIEVLSYGVNVYLDFDPTAECREKSVIPITYDIVDEFAYIPDREYRKLYNTDDYGIDFSEINLIKEIMEYLENHKKEINDLCCGYSWEMRKHINDGQ